MRRAVLARSLHFCYNFILSVRRVRALPRSPFSVLTAQCLGHHETNIF